ncbi:oxidoreductase [Corynebacterium sp. YIM 101645]|uniref:Oxidoreductase n=1 Tax=Corynebacterium lemuris TaxID=1859292 RepID=A0ABT2G0B7_9CORY|nr:oxidoreductase [Corynebacterium lemuris]
MSPAQISLGALVLVPLSAAVLTAALPPAVRHWPGLLAALSSAVLTLPVLWVVQGGQVVELSLGGHSAPLGIHLRADGFSVLLFLLTAVVGGLVTVFAAAFPASTGRRMVAGAQPGTLRWQPAHPAFWPLWLGCWSGLNAVFVAGDLFNTYVGLEMVGLTAVGLVALGRTRAWEAALRYLFIAVLGSLLFLIAVGLVVSVTGTLDINQAAGVIAATPDNHAVVVTALILLTVGLSLKVALVPLHGWLIPAHAGSPTAVSPLLSALVIKASLFVLLRCWLWLVAPGMSTNVGAPEAVAAPAIATTLAWLSWTLAGLGTLAIVFGAVMALRQSRLKPLVAYSTVAQVGYWFLFFPVLLNPESGRLEELPVTTLGEDVVIAGAFGGTLCLVLGHGVAKATLFLAAGYLKEIYGTDELDQLRGVGRNHAGLVLAMGMSAIGLAGLPISLSFSGKWLLSTSAIASGQYWIVGVIVLATLLSAAYLLRMMAPLLIEAEDDGHLLNPPERRQSSLPAVVLLPPLVLGLLTLVTGFSGAWVVDLLEVGAPW